ncbi:hypothetical protein BDV95DRAFT_498745 [Massariosphaeria phaeospora]|uniref:Transcription initiation factor TFIID subunit 2 n=1 Tax=Massariosphaeria phaeospora TaxID=100035 RepID=A0A7C8M5T0_9PLEO|nr:hypothetical protein BDV95DRAFT_498745 [Massariosphaeria phaeospora]
MAPIETGDAPDEPSATAFTVLKQKLDLDFSFAPRIVKGRTTLEIQPHSPHLREIHLNCRQLKPTRITVQGRPSSCNYSNLYQRLTLHPGTGIEQHHFVKDRFRRHENGIEDELLISIPDRVKIREIRPEDVDMEAAAGGIGALGDGMYAPLKVVIEYTLDEFRDGLHFVGVDDGDSRYPHAYTQNSPYAGSASCLFPCVDDGITKCIFDISVRYPRSLGDALCKTPAPGAGRGTQAQAAGSPKADSVMSDVDDEQEALSEEEKAMEMSVVCSGELTDDILDPNDSTRKTASFTCAVPVLPQHIGIAVGVFEEVDLSEYRNTSDDERLGSNAIRVHAFCLPGRADEVRNSAMMLAMTLDSFTERYQSYPFEKAYKLAFVDDLESDTTHTASFSICSSRLLFPETVYEPMAHTTRVLIHAVASQWIGINVTAQNPQDSWIIFGGSWFMTELYLRDLFGRNDFKFRQKLMADKIIEMDTKRPSLFNLGYYLALDTGEVEFMELKALLVLSVLHNRLVKQSGKNGVDRCLYRLLFNARNDKLPNNAITTDTFLDVCEKVGHQKLDTFFKQWIYGSGCPMFECAPVFNKKKQVVQLTIKQTQTDSIFGGKERGTVAKDFLREIKESEYGFKPTTEWPAFVGPMTIRIHEADGTPYEHIVDINSSTVKVEIPYNTKYKRLKRNKLQKERQAAAQGLDGTGEAQEDITFYSLGDLFQSPVEADEWKIAEWSADDESRMENESYEWIRIDADFEWICRTHIVDMPAYMYVSQLQQDKDVVAQVESIQFLARKEGHPLISSFLVKTLMDVRYFHGIRTMAADVMASSAKAELDWIGFFHLEKAFRELFCITDNAMTRSNDFSDRGQYLVQCAIPQAIAKIKGPDGKAPMKVKRFLLDIMRYNDNRGNDYNDDHYLATLMQCLAESLAVTKPSPASQDPTLSLEDEAEEFEFTRKAIEELGRHQRLDEWIPTYQNIYTRTTLECALKLMRNHVIPLKPSEFLQYTRIGISDNVRKIAWNCLTALGMIRKNSVLKFMIHSIYSDSSPYFRSHLIRVFEFAIGQIATDSVFALEEPTAQMNGGLVIDDQTGTSLREATLQRQTLQGAKQGLKSDLAGNMKMRQSLEQALCSKTLSARHVNTLLQVVALFVPAVNSLTVQLDYPRYWRVQHIRDGKLRFYHSDRVRTRAVRPLEPPKPVVAVSKEVPKLKLNVKRNPEQAAPSLPTPVQMTKPTIHLPASVREPKIGAPGNLSPSSTTTPKEKTPGKLSRAASPAMSFPTQSPAPPARSSVPAHSPAPAAVIPKAEPIPTPTPTPTATPAPAPPPKTMLKLKTGKSAAAKPSAKAASSKPAATPKQPKAKKSLLIKLKLHPADLAGLSDPSRKKRKAEDDGGRAPKRQASGSEEPLHSGRGAYTGAATVIDRVGGERPRLVLKMRVGKGKLPVETRD